MIKNINHLDIFILKTINKNKTSGTMELSKLIGIAPKNLINRLNKLFSLGLLTKNKKSLKPKGWKRIWLVSSNGIKMINADERYNKTIEFISKNFEEVEKEVLGNEDQKEIHNLIEENWKKIANEMKLNNP